MNFFKTIDDLAAAIPIYKTVKLEDVTTDVFVTEETHLVPILGRRFYDQLLDTYHEGTPSDAEADLIILIQRMVASMMAPLTIPKINAQVKNTGISQNHGENSKPAFQWSVEDLKRTHWTVGYACMEALYDYLERFKGDFAEWVADDGYSEIYSLLVWNTYKFQKFVDIKTSRRVFIALKPHLLEAQETVGKTIGKELLAACLADVPDLEDAEILNLMPYIQKAMCHLAMRAGLNSMALIVDHNGVSVYDNSATSLELNNVKNASDARMQAVVNFHQQNADKALEDLRAFLIENIEDYPLFEESSAYDADYTRGSINDTDRTVFSL
jgi:hypothetical protein